MLVIGKVELDGSAAPKRSRVGDARRVVIRKMKLKVGDAAPDFSMVGSDGKTYTLSQFKGKKGVVIAWFPKAFTGG